MVQALMMVLPSEDTHVKFRLQSKVHPNYSLPMNKRRVHLSGPKCTNVRGSIYKLCLLECVFVLNVSTYCASCLSKLGHF